MDSVAVTVNAPAEKVYDLLADIAQMGRWSPECTGGRWVGGASEAIPGARFKGSNRHGVMRWTTNCEVIRAERGKAFEWQVKESGMRWGDRFEAQPDGTTVVTEYRERTREAPLPIRLFLKTGALGRDREGLMIEGMRQTLQRLKAAAEGVTSLDDRD
jgi:uncharacterized protein YndB with AHSA1/START domain